MPTWDQATTFIANQGLAVFLVAFFVFACVSFAGFIAFAARQIWTWYRPHLQRESEKRCAMYDAVTKGCTQAPIAHRRVMRGQGHIGSMMLSESELEKRIHFEQLQSEIDSADED